MPMLYERFKDYIDRKHLLSRGDKIILAVSGGPDSLCLLHLFDRLAFDYKLKLVVAHLNHGLRPEAVLEEKGVAAFADRLNLPFESKTVDIRNYKKETGLSEEAAGRKARYHFLLETARKYKATAIALGHHRDDQSETVLLNLLRGSGIDGLAGILPLRSVGNIRLIRPLLSFRRSEIEKYCLEKGLQPYTDSSNLEQDYTRNKIRLELIPHLEQRYNPRIREALASLADLAAEDRRFLRYLARRKATELAEFKENSLYLNAQALTGLPVALSGRVLRLLLFRFRTGKEFSRLHIEQLIALSKGRKPGVQLHLPGRLRAYRTTNNLVVTRKSLIKKNKDAEIRVIIPGVTRLPGGREICATLSRSDELEWPPVSSFAYLDYDQLPSGRIIVRFRKPGDRFFPQGSGGSKKLKRFMIDQKVDRFFRDQVPLVTVGEEIIWVAGMRIAHPYRVTERTSKVLVLEYKG